MTRFVDTMSGLSDDKLIMKSQFNTREQAMQVFKLFVESLETEQGPVIIERRNLAGDILIWGNPSFGIWGQFKWGNVAQMSFILGHPEAAILGVSRLGSTISEWATARVVNPGNLFKERIFSTIFRDASTTARWDITNRRIEMNNPASPPESAISKIIFKDDANILTATLTSTDEIPANTTITYHLSANNGVNWELVSNGVAHNFVNVGQELRWRAILSNSDNTSSPKIYKVEVLYTTA